MRWIFYGPRKISYTKSDFHLCVVCRRYTLILLITDSLWTLKFPRILIGDSFFNTTAGVCQGGSTSCFLFTFFIYMTIHKIAGFGVDGFLGLLHCFLLMDDKSSLPLQELQCKENYPCLWKQQIKPICPCTQPNLSTLL